MHELSTKYDILKVIGHGGFSAVFKAREKAPPYRVVALKQLDYTIENEDAKEYQDFKDEVEILKKLDHPNIIKIYDEYVLDDKPSLEMEFIDGENLESILKREKYLSVDEVLELISQMASALMYCHHYHIPDEQFAGLSASALFKKNAIIHNDINSKNILRTVHEDGSYRYVLIDFGLSFTDPDAVRHSKKEEGMAEYKAPEKWSGAGVDTPSDMYSFGIVLYELLTGTVPFPVTDYKQAREMILLEEKHANALVPDICDKRKALLQSNDCDIPDWLVLLVKKCLEKEPAKRFKTGKELQDYFHDGINGLITVDKEIDPVSDISIHIDLPVQDKEADAYLDVAPNILTEAQRFTISLPVNTIGRMNEVPGSFNADIAITTADKFISKNHCQVIRQVNSRGEVVYMLQDNVPSKNGTYYNREKNTLRLSPTEKVLLKDGDYFWVGNTKLVFKAPRGV